MVSKTLSPEYFKRCAETIHKHKWAQDFAYKSLFRKFMYIFDSKDVKEFNNLSLEFSKKWVFEPVEMDDKINHMMSSGRIIRVKIDGRKYHVNLNCIHDMEDLVRWCHKKLNEYYKIYGISIDGLDASDVETIELYD